MWMLPDIWNSLLAFFKKRADKGKAQARAIAFAKEYDAKEGVNLTYIAANKIANLTVTDSTLNVTCARSKQRESLLAACAKEMWDVKKTIVSRTAGKGKVCALPYCPDGQRIAYSLVAQDKIRVLDHDGQRATDVVILCDAKKIGTVLYGKFKRYTLEDNNHVISEVFANLTSGTILGATPPAATGWHAAEPLIITNVNRLLFGEFDCPVDGRCDEPFYAAKITDGCDGIIADIQQQFEYIRNEYDLKQVRIGADETMFEKDPKTGKRKLPKKQLFMLLSTSGEDERFQVFDPAIRADPVFKRLSESFKLLENQIGVSRGIFSDSENLGQYSNKSNIKRAVYDTYSMVDAFRANIQRGVRDYLYACNVLAEYYHLSPSGVSFEDVEVDFSWSYDMVEDSTESFTQLAELIAGGMMSSAEGRQWFTGEDLATAQEQVDSIAQPRE